METVMAASRRKWTTRPSPPPPQVGQVDQSDSEHGEIRLVEVENMHLGGGVRPGSPHDHLVETGPRRRSKEIDVPQCHRVKRTGATARS